MWDLYFTKRAQRDAKNISAAGLRNKTERLLEILRENPFQNPVEIEFYEDPKWKNWQDFVDMYERAEKDL